MKHKRIRAQRSGKLIPSVLPACKSFVLGSMAITLVCSVPIIIDWGAYVAGLQTSAVVQSRAAAIKPPIFDLIAVHDPLIVLTALIVLIFKRDLGLLLAFSIAVVMAYQFMIYPTRLIYLLPYLLAVVGGAAAYSWEGMKPGLGKAVLSRALVTLLLWNMTIVLLLRPLATYHQRSAANPVEITSELKRVVGDREYRVLTGDWAPYVAGRSLGWQLYSPGA